MMQRELVTSLVCQAVVALYLQFIEWVDVFPWNDVRSGNGQELLDIALALATAGALVSTYRMWRPGIFFGLALYIVWFLLQVLTFWVPYINGASEHWQRIYEANFSQTVQLLPRVGNHLPPDASHFVLQLLLIAAVSTTVVLLWRSRPAYDPSRQERLGAHS